MVHVLFVILIFIFFGIFIVIVFMHQKNIKEKIFYVKLIKSKFQQIKNKHKNKNKNDLVDLKNLTNLVVSYL